MKNEYDLDALWPQLSARGAAALRPNLAARVLEKHKRELAMPQVLSVRNILTLGTATALACLTLTLAFSAWKAHHDSKQAMEQWAGFRIDNSLDQDT